MGSLQKDRIFASRLGGRPFAAGIVLRCATRALPQETAGTPKTIVKTLEYHPLIFIKPMKVISILILIGLVLPFSVSAQAGQADLAVTQCKHPQRWMQNDGCEVDGRAERQASLLSARR